MDILTNAQPQDTMNNLVRTRLELKQSNPELFNELEQRMPLVTRNTNTAADVQNVPQPSQSSQLLNAISGLLTQSLGDKKAQDIFTQLSGLQTPKLQGPDLISMISGGAPSRGGIMGTGMEPIDVLAFALGAGITSNMPQDKALATTFSIAKLPSQFRENQRKSAEQFIDNALRTIQAENAATHLRQQEALMKIQGSKAGLITQMSDKVRSGMPLSTDDLTLMAINGVGGMEMTDIAGIKAGKLQYDAKRGVVVDIQNGLAKPVVGPDGQVLGEAESEGGLNTYDARSLALFGKRFRDLDPGSVQQKSVIASVDNAAMQRIAIMNQGQSFNMENALRDDFNKELSGFKDLSDQYGRLRVANKDQSGASDIAFVFTYMKMLDRMSVVRESEQEQVRQLATYKEQATLLYNNLVSGKMRKLPENVRKDIFRLASQWHSEEAKSAKAVSQQFQRRAKGWGVNSELFEVGERSMVPQERRTKELPPGFVIQQGGEY